MCPAWTNPKGTGTVCTLAVPGVIPLMPAVIVTQTLIELTASLVYIRVMPRLVT